MDSIVKVYKKIIPQKREFILISAIILIGFFIRIYNIHKSDVITDESSLAFRSIGMIDFDAAKDQPSPWEKIDPPKDWMRLSFHDHPPLFFLTQHISLKIFGENNYGLRIPSVIFGTLSILLIYLITKKVVDKKTAIIASILSSLNAYLIWVSKIGLQESMVIFLMLVTIYFFLLFMDESKYFFILGIFLGLSWLTKYTAFILLPIMLLHIFFADRKIFQKRYIWLAFTTALIFFSPVIIYNIKLYQEFGHFDFQFSYIFGQKVAEWSIQPGKEEFVDITHKFVGFFQNLKNGLSAPIFILFFVSICFFTYSKKNTKNIFIIISLSSLFIFFMIIGPSQRFLSLIIPFIIIIVAYTLKEAIKTKDKLLSGVIALLVLSEIIFSFHSTMSIKSKNYFSRDIHANFSYSGYNELNTWIEKLFKNKKPSLSLNFGYTFLNSIKNKVITDNKKMNAGASSILLVYDEDMNEASSLWIIHRQIIYHAWPALSTKEYLDEIEKNENDYFKSQGFQEIYFIKATEYALGKKFGELSKNSDKLMQKLNLSSPMHEIKNSENQISFVIFKLL